MGIHRIVESAQVVSDSSTNTADEAALGNESIQKAVRQMKAIGSSVETSATMVTQLSERSREIEKIIEVITGIASQTNLLALNAAIEAARAGEHGKGFAVVADEVRKLAELSRVSADQITTLIHEIQHDTEQVVSSMRVGTEEVKAGVAVVQEAGEAFHKISQAIKEVSGQIQEVSSATEQMSASVEEITASVEGMSQFAKASSANSQQVAQVSEEQLAAMEEITASVHSLADMAEELERLVHRFQV